MRKFITSVNEKDSRYEDLLNYLCSERKVDKVLAAAELDKFISYWTELNKSGTKQRWELEKTFEVQKRLLTWFRRANKSTGYQSQNKVSNIIF
jgi:hypothetical protein